MHTAGGALARIPTFQSHERNPFGHDPEKTLHTRRRSLPIRGPSESEPDLAPINPRVKFPNTASAGRQLPDPDVTDQV